MIFGISVYVIVCKLMLGSLGAVLDVVRGDGVVFDCDGIRADLLGEEHILERLSPGCRWGDVENSFVARPDILRLYCSITHPGVDFVAFVLDVEALDVLPEIGMRWYTIQGYGQKTCAACCKELLGYLIGRSW